MGDYVRWAPPFHEGVQDSAKSALFLALNRGKRSIRLNLKEDRGREVLLRLVEDADVVVEGFRPGVMDRLGVGYEALRERNPGIVFCSITGYGQTGPVHRALGPRHELPGPDRHARPDRAGRRRAGAVGGPDRRPGRRRAHGRLLDPGRAARGRAHRAGPGGGRVDGRRRPDLADHGGRPVPGRRPAAGPRGREPDRRHRLLPALRLRRRPRDAGGAGAQVLGRVVRRRGPRRPDGQGLRPARLGDARRGGADLRRAHARRVGRVRRPARLLPGAGAGPGRGAGLRAGARARDGGRGRPAGGAGAGPGAGPPGEVLGHPGRRHPARPGAGRAHRRGAGGPGLHARAGGRAGVRGRGRRAAGGRHRRFLS